MAKTNVSNFLFVRIQLKAKMFIRYQMDPLYSGRLINNGATKSWLNTEQPRAGRNTQRLSKQELVEIYNRWHNREKLIM